MIPALVAACVLLATGLFAFIFIFIRHREKMRAMERRLSPIHDADVELERLHAEAGRVRAEQETLVAKARAAAAVIVQKQRSAVREAEEELAANKREEGVLIDRTREIKAILTALEDDLEVIEHGLYRPSFKFEHSDEYKKALNALYEQQKTMIKDGVAATCGKEWQVGGDAKEGARMVRDNIKLVLRAFNGDAESAIALVTWTNIEKMRERVRKSSEQVEKLAARLEITIDATYVNLKLQELDLTFEHAERKEREREEQRVLRAEAREEEREQREAERQVTEAESERVRTEKALEEARREIAGLHGEALAEAEARVEAAQMLAHEAIANATRAVAQAQLTKTGHIYIISNIGSFGEDVFKIGMTRRLNPDERIDELGDASVPFTFDIHAKIKTDNAPALETELHDALWHRRVNRVNNRKEFFRVPLKEICELVRARGHDVQFTMVAEAKEYRLSQAGDEAVGSAPRVVLQTTEG